MSTITFDIKDFKYGGRIRLEYGDFYEVSVEADLEKGKGDTIEASQSTVDDDHPQVKDYEQDTIVDDAGQPLTVIPTTGDAAVVEYADKKKETLAIEVTKINDGAKLTFKTKLKPSDWTKIAKGAVVYRFVAVTREKGPAEERKVTQKRGLALELRYSLTLARALELAPNELLELGPASQQPHNLLGKKGFDSVEPRASHAAGNVVGNSAVPIDQIRIKTPAVSNPKFAPLFPEGGKRINVCVINPASGQRMVLKVQAPTAPAGADTLAEVNPGALGFIGLADGARAIVGFCSPVTPLSTPAVPTVPPTMPTRLVDRRAYEDMFRAPAPFDPATKVPRLVTFTTTRRVVPLQTPTPPAEDAELLLRVDGELGLCEVHQLIKKNGVLVPADKPLTFASLGATALVDAARGAAPTSGGDQPPARRTGNALQLSLSGLDRGQAYDEEVRPGGHFPRKVLGLRVVARSTAVTDPPEVRADLVIVLEDPKLSTAETTVRLFDGYYKERGFFDNTPGQDFRFLDANLDALLGLCNGEDGTRDQAHTLYRRYGADSNMNQPGDGAGEEPLPGVPNFCIYWSHQVSNETNWPDPPTNIEDYTKNFCGVRSLIAQAFYVTFFRQKCAETGALYADSVDDLLAHLFMNAKNGVGSRVGAWDVVANHFDWCASASNLALIRGAARGGYTVPNKDSETYGKAGLQLPLNGESAWQRNGKIAPAPGDIVSYVMSGVASSGHVVTIAAAHPPAKWPNGKYWYVSGNTSPSHNTKKPNKRYGVVNIGFGLLGVPDAALRPEAFNPKKADMPQAKYDERKKAQTALVNKIPKGEKWPFSNVRTSRVQPVYLATMNDAARAAYAAGLNIVTPLKHPNPQLDADNQRRAAIDLLVVDFVKKPSPK